MLKKFVHSATFTVIIYLKVFLSLKFCEFFCLTVHLNDFFTIFQTILIDQQFYDLRSGNYELNELAYRAYRPCRSCH